MRVPDFLNEIADGRSVYPRGIVGSLKESSFDSAKAERIELFAHMDEARKSFGILKQLFVALSSEETLLRLASASSNVIEVHGIHRNEKDENGKALTQSKLVLKRSQEEERQLKDIIPSYVERTPKILVSSHWLDVMNLNPGDRVIVSNPREHYEIPPPVTIR